MADDSSGPGSTHESPSRRRVFSVIGAGGAAVAAGLFPRPAQAAHGGGVDDAALHLGELNTGPGAPTTLTDSIVGGTTLTVVNEQEFGAIRASAGTIAGDPSFDPDAPPTILVLSAHGAAILASRSAAEEGNAVEAHGGGVGQSVVGFGTIVGFGNVREESLPEGQPLGSGEGVVGASEQPTRAGVLGESQYLLNRGFEGQPPPLGIGVMGRSGTGTGVIGEAFTNDPRPEYVDGTGVLGRSGQGTGVRGESDSGVGVEAVSSSGQALNVVGRAQIEAEIDPGAVLTVTNLAAGDGAIGIAALVSGQKPAVAGESRGSEGIGVLGVSSAGGFADGDGDGVSGTTGTGIAVRGETPNGVGVRGHSDTNIGVWASGLPAAAALHVSGRAVFETAGSGVVPAGSNAGSVATTVVGPDSQVIVTLMGNPGNRAVRWVQVTPGVGFTVHLSPAPPNGRPATPFAYLVVDRAT